MQVQEDGALVVQLPERGGRRWSGAQQLRQGRLLDIRMLLGTDLLFVKHEERLINADMARHDTTPPANIIG